MVYDRNEITSEQILPYTTSFHTNLQFKPTHEIRISVNCLDLLMCRNTHVLDIHLQKSHLYRYDNSSRLQPTHGTLTSSLQILYKWGALLTLKTNTRDKTSVYTVLRPMDSPILESQNPILL
jgi:UDP-N-acetylglucosamine pyrophosphorylase